MPEKVKKTAHKCPICGKTEFPERGSFDICTECGWEDDMIQTEDPYEEAGANMMSLNEYKAAYESGWRPDWLADVKIKLKATDDNSICVKTIVGAIVGDVVGSVYEFNNIKTKDFPLFKNGCFATDDSIMTLAVAKAVMESNEEHSDLGDNAVRYMQEIGRPYPRCGYGGNFMNWIYSERPQPYNSFGNGSAMRVSPVAYAAKSLAEAEKMAKLVTEVTHNHPEGVKGAKATAGAVWLALNGASQEDIGRYVKGNYYKIDFTLDEIRPTYEFNEICQDTVPQAIEAFLEARDFEEALRNAISIGGDSDTLAAITCSIAGAYWGVPESIMKKSASYLDDRLSKILVEFDNRYCS